MKKAINMHIVVHLEDVPNLEQSSLKFGATTESPSSEVPLASIRLPSAFWWQVWAPEDILGQFSLSITTSAQVRHRDEEKPVTRCRGKVQRQGAEARSRARSRSREQRQGAEQGAETGGKVLEVEG
jgi:hypothetical protein